MNAETIEATRTAGPQPLTRLLQAQQLNAHFQPIVELAHGTVYAHEALARGPAGPLHSPDAMLEAARAEGMLGEFERRCVGVAWHRWAALRQRGRLFLNISATALVEAQSRETAMQDAALLKALGLQPRMLVMEITEHERVGDMPALLEAAARVRATGAALALDDFGDGRSSLRLWSQLRPEFVKIDKYFTRGVADNPDNVLTLRALVQLAETFGTSLVAEGIETLEDLLVIRDLGIAYGQGYLFGRPAPAPVDRAPEAVEQRLKERRVAVMPNHARQPGALPLRKLAIVEAPGLPPDTNNEALGEFFRSHPALHAVAIVQDGLPVGLVNRQQFMTLLTTPYFKEIYGRKPCTLHANHAPRLVERAYDVDELLGILTSQDQRYLADGFIVTDNGHYVGLGTGEQLVRSVTEARIEAARHANPLTFLPGNIPISLHLQRLIDRGAPFTACYVDMDNFKPFNDHYGYWRGDQMIQLLAAVLTRHADRQSDFVGHVGGDDFIVVFQSPDWLARCERAIAEFADEAALLFDEPARRAGGIHAEDRHGVPRFFPCTTIAVGALPAEAGQYRHPEDVANAAALAKHEAKRTGRALHVHQGPPSTTPAVETQGDGD